MTASEIISAVANAIQTEGQRQAKNGLTTGEPYIALALIERDLELSHAEVRGCLTEALKQANLEIIEDSGSIIKVRGKNRISQRLSPLDM